MTDSDLGQLARGTTGRPKTMARGTDIPLPRRRWKTRVLLPGVILLATAAVFVAAAGDAVWPAKSVRVVPVLLKTDVGRKAAGRVLVQAPGWVEADPFSTAVSALTNGVVEDVLVLEGDHVERGQVVARLIADDARIALDQASATLAERRASLSMANAMRDEAKLNWEHPVELTRKLATADAHLAEKYAELARWPSELAREQAQAAYLEAEYDRVAPLYDKGQASNIELPRAREAFGAQRAEVEATRLRKAVLEAQAAALQAEVDAAREQLRLRIADTRALAEAEAGVRLAEAAIASAEARREEAALRLARVEVRSLADGVVMTRLVEPGSKVMLGMDHPRSAQVVRLYDPKRLQVRVDIPLVDAATVQLGQPAEVIVDVLPNRVFAGRVTRIVHEADVQKNTLQVKVAIASPSPEIKPEMLARARFFSMPGAAGTAGETGTAERMFVPRSALFEAEDRSFVWLADQVEKVARRTGVTPGQTVIDDWVMIAEGLRPGDRVIVDAPTDLRDGQRLRMVEE